MPPLKKKQNKNQKDIRSWAKDTRIVISRDKKNVSNIGKTISETSLSNQLKEKGVIKNAFIDMCKKNISEELKDAIEKQIIERCGERHRKHKTKNMKKYIEIRFYRLFSYKFEKLCSHQVRSREDFDKFKEPRTRISVPWEELTWKQFIWSNVPSLTVFDIKLRKGDDFEITDEIYLCRLEQLFLNALCNRGRRIPFRNLIEFYELETGVEVDCLGTLAPAEVKMTKEVHGAPSGVKMATQVANKSNQIVVVADVHSVPFTSKEIPSSASVVNDLPAKQLTVVVDNTNGLDRTNNNVVDKPGTRIIMKFSDLKEFITHRKVVEFLDNDLKSKFPAKYEEMRKNKFDHYLTKLYERYKTNETTNKVINKCIETTNVIEPHPPLVETVEENVIERNDEEIVEDIQTADSVQTIEETCEEIVPEVQIEVEVVEDVQTVYEECIVRVEETEIVEDEEVAATQIEEIQVPVDGVLPEISDVRETVDDVLMETQIEDSQIVLPESQTDVLMKPLEEPAEKLLDQVSLMEIDEDSEEIPIKVEQFSPYKDDVEEIPVPEVLPHTIEDSFDINNCFDACSQESFLSKLENDAIKRLDNDQFQVPAIPKIRPNIKETTSGIISKHTYKPLNFNIEKRPFNTRQPGVKPHFEDVGLNDSESLSQLIDNNVSQDALLDTELSVFEDSQLLRRSNNEVKNKTIFIPNKLKQTKNLILAKLSKKSKKFTKKRKVVDKLKKRQPIDLSKIHFLNDLFISSVKFGSNQSNLSSCYSREPKLLMKIRSGLKTINLRHEDDIRIVTGLKRKEFRAFIDLFKKTENFDYTGIGNRSKGVSSEDRIGCSTVDKVLKLFLMNIPRFKSVLLKLSNCNGADDFEVSECTNSVQSVLPTQNASMVLDPYVRLCIQNAKKGLSDINC